MSSLTRMHNVIHSIEPLGFPFKCLDPFLFTVHHKDFYPKGNDRMEAPIRGNGADFDFRKDYRMYHGDKIPGFPQHPHRGFETITCTTMGLIDHTDSQGNCGRYGNGDLQWMTAGSGIVHGEMFPLIHSDKANPLRLFQIWINLPPEKKMVEPDFVMMWNEEIPQYVDGGTSVTVWAGQVGDKVGLPPPKNSWAANPSNEVGVLLIKLAPSARFTLPAARGPVVNRMAYFIEGEKLEVGPQSLSSHSAIKLNASMDADFVNSGSLNVEILLLQGKPIGAPVAQQGPFVMNTQQEIQQAFNDYRRTQFGGWPWPEDAMVFPKDKGRFARVGGKEFGPPSV